MLLSIFSDSLIVGEGVHLYSDGNDNGGIYKSSGFDLMFLVVILSGVSIGLGVCSLLLNSQHKNDSITIFENKVILHFIKDKFELTYHDIISCKRDPFDDAIRFETTTHQKPIKFIWMSNSSKVISEINRLKNLK